MAQLEQYRPAELTTKDVRSRNVDWTHDVFSSFHATLKLTHCSGTVVVKLPDGTSIQGYVRSMTIEVGQAEWGEVEATPDFDEPLVVRGKEQ